MLNIRDISFTKFTKSVQESFHIFSLCDVKLDLVGEKCQNFTE